MSALLRALARRVRLALHRHDPIECWCELTSSDAPRDSILPIQLGPFSCAHCWTPPGKTHELSCKYVTPEQFRRYLGLGGAR